MYSKGVFRTLSNICHTLSIFAKIPAISCSLLESDGQDPKYAPSKHGGLFYMMRCANWYHLHNLKNVKNTHG